MKLEIIPVPLECDVKPGDRIDNLISSSLDKLGEKLCDGDIMVIAQKIVSKAEGRIVDLRDICPSPSAIEIAKIHGKDPRLVELILQESEQIIKLSSGIIIVETKHGFICANAGIDQSNILLEYHALLLPKNPDLSARRLQEEMEKRFSTKIAVIISDTFGRPFREGQVNVAIGIAGMSPILDYIGSNDMYGKKLKVTQIAIADEIAAAAELVMGKRERIPVAILRGYRFKYELHGNINSLLRSKEKDLFRP